MKIHHWMPSLVLIAGAAALAACSSAPPAATSGSAAAPAAAVPEPASEKPSAGPEALVATAPASVSASAFVTFYREKRILGAALNTSVHVDRVEVADLDPGDYVKVSLTPGPHSFYADEEKDTLQLVVEPGREYYFRIELQAGLWKGHGVLRAVDTTVGAMEFKTWELKPAEDVRAPGMVVRDPGKP